MSTDWKKYIIVFLLTLGIFGLAIYASNYFNTKKLDQISSLQDTISIDILSSETQFSLLSELSCKEVSGSSALSPELNSLAEKISFTEENIKNAAKVTELKKYYSLLEIKDYILMNKISERCGKKVISVLYFYTTEANCSECTRQGYVLSALREKYPDLRVYSFDYTLDLSALRALISIYKVEDTKLPAIVINGKLVTGYQSVEDVEKLLPELGKVIQKK